MAEMVLSIMAYKFEVVMSVLQLMSLELNSWTRLNKTAILTWIQQMSHSLTPHWSSMLTSAPLSPRYLTMSVSPLVTASIKEVFYWEGEKQRYAIFSYTYHWSNTLFNTMPWSCWISAAKIDCYVS